MKTDLTTLDDGRVKLTIEVDESTFEEEISEAFKRIAREVRVPGFRPGKVPRRVLEARIGSEVARTEALESAIPQYYATALRDHQVDAIAPPDIDLTSGQESGPVAFDAVVEIRPEITVEGYRELQIEVPAPVPTDDEVDEQVDRIRAQFADLEDVSRPAIDGDHVSIDIIGELDGEPVPGLTADDYLYEVGQGAVVPELDAQLRGSKAGDILAFDAAHPTEEGQRIDFRILVKQVKQRVLPELTDEWIDENTEFSTVDELRADITERMSRVQRYRARITAQQQLSEALAGLVTDDAVPDAMVDRDAAERLHQFAHRLEDRGVSLDDWMSQSGSSVEDLQGEARDGARSAAKIDLALRAVARLEGLEVTEDDVDAEIGRLAEQYGQDPGELRAALESGDGFMGIRSELLKRKAADWLLDEVEIVDSEGRTVDRGELELPETDPATDEVPDEVPDEAHEDQGAHDHEDDEDREDEA
jgi:trigger factor